MKRLIVLLAFCSLSFSALAQPKTVFTEGLRFCEGSVPYKHMVLVSNFGGDALNPLNRAGKGYIAAINGDEVKTLIPGGKDYLNAPKGMAVLENHLFVADVGCVAVFNLKKPNDRPRYIKLSDDDLFANDVVVLGTLVLVSVTNTGKIYAIDATDINHLGAASEVGSVEGANGMAVWGTKIYIASYNPNEKPTSANVIYVYDITDPTPKLHPLIKDLPGGQYDGIALSEDGSRIYFSSWTGKNGGAIYSYALNGTEQVRTLDFGPQLTGPADISIVGNMIYIPDLPESKVYRFQL
ncbi:MAG: hypothetical protein RSF93_01505 [Mucinivorans sp.]